MFEQDAGALEANKKMDRRAVVDSNRDILDELRKLNRNVKRLINLLQEKLPERLNVTIARGFGGDVSGSDVFITREDLQKASKCDSDQFDKPKCGLYEELRKRLGHPGKCRIKMKWQNCQSQ